MRDIKFRAWDTIKKEWISSTCGEPFFEFYEGYIKVKTLEEYHEIQGGEDVECERWHDHPNAIVMQYTGLRDKNGVEIYEGDIVQTNHVSTGKIEWSPMASQWWIIYTDDVAYRKTYKELTPDYGDGQNYCQYLEVIGNIHEQLTRDKQRGI